MPSKAGVIQSIPVYLGISSSGRLGVSGQLSVSGKLGVSGRLGTGFLERLLKHKNRNVAVGARIFLTSSGMRVCTLNDVSF